MMLNTAEWRRYHEFVCSPGLPWDCEKRCALWRRFDFQKRANEGRYATYATLERRG